MLLTILDNFLYYTFDSEVSKEDSESYHSIFTHFVRLLCIITYDVRICDYLVQDDLQSFTQMNKSIKKLESTSAEAEALFITRLRKYWDMDKDNAVVSLLFSHIFRNLSCSGIITSSITIINRKCFDYSHFFHRLDRYLGSGHPRRSRTI